MFEEGVCTAKWYVLFCKAGRDALVESGLSNKGFVVYRPVIEGNKKANGKVGKIRKESMFPRYVFIRLNESCFQKIDEIRYYPGVVKFVQFGIGYASIADDVICKIRQFRENWVSQKKQDAYLREGDFVNINADGFHEILGTVSKLSSKERVFVLINWLEQSKVLEVHIDLLEKVS
ncbi:transcription termination/antitermination protein NusG [Microbulbifer spongiae]|uniref:NusG-like N-terminal domain-containing protein n=1 Tax=Microbulbifer spongiae TaxID=2944933 RepID=A0ABY9E9R8_9GAMM|nr:transcription termination/antitermination NusG family protein [Microbulbifer sp. MI-G]WKD49195.1 hypothetical protein M8T91_15025 [Microbulbifer sp. MI-G]